MTESTQQATMPNAAQSYRGPGGPGAPLPDALNHLIAELQGAGADVVFGAPRTIGERTLIPVAAKLEWLAFGRGRGPQAGPEAETGPAWGEGMGGGGMVRTRPVALVVADANGVSVHPIVNVNRLAYLALLLGGLALIARAIRG
jgi:uncharacterized spore protein YtfJ